MAADRLLAQTSPLEQKDAELANNASESEAQRIAVVSRPARCALCICRKQRPARLMPKGRSQRAYEQITGRRYETELGEVHAELEAKNSKLEAVRLRSTDVENG